MKIAIIDKDLFASLLRFGEIKMPDYSFSVLSEELPAREAIRLILESGNPIEYPSQYIIIRYDNGEANVHDCSLNISDIVELIATNSDSRKLFSSQFRDDLIIQKERYADVFEHYFDNQFQEKRILNGIKAFRWLCGLECSGDYADVTDEIFGGLRNRNKFGHHYNLPPEERDKPYSLMIVYDRHSPYSKAWAGYFEDVIETFVYHTKHDLHYSEGIAEKSHVYKLINELGPKATSKEISNKIKDEDFTKKCNEFFARPGGYLVPYIFFILRDKFRSSDDFKSQKNLIEQIKQSFPEAFDTAASYIGGFFGYDKFYEDYYTSLNLPIFKHPEAGQETIPEEKKPSVGATEQIEPEVEEKESTDKRGDLLEDGDGETDIFGNVSTLSDIIKKAISACTTEGAKLRENLINGIEAHKNNEEEINAIFSLFTSPEIVKKDFEEYFKFDRGSFRKDTIKKIGGYLQKDKS